MKSNEELMKEALDEKIKMPEELAEMLDKTIFYNILMSIGIMGYLLFMNVAYFYLDADVFKSNMKIVALLLIALTVLIFEIAHEKDSGTLSLTGVEMMILSLVVLYMPFAYKYESYLIRNLIMLTSVFFAIYYVGKLIVLYVMAENEHKKSLSDVQEITEKDNKSYLDESSEKKFEKGE